MIQVDHPRCWSKLRLALIGLAAAVLLTVSGCLSKPGQEDTMPTRDIKTVMEAHVDSLMAIPGVVGVGVGHVAAVGDLRAETLVVHVRPLPSRGWRAW